MVTQLRILSYYSALSTFIKKNNNSLRVGDRIVFKISIINTMRLWKQTSVDESEDI